MKKKLQQTRYLTKKKIIPRYHLSYEKADNSSLFPLAKVQQLIAEISSVLTVTYGILMKLNFRVLYLNCRRPHFFLAPTKSLCGANAKYLNQVQNVKKVIMQTSDLVLTSFHRSCQPTLQGKYCSYWALVHLVLPISYVSLWITPIFTILTFCIYTAILLLFFIFTSKFHTAAHACIMRYRMWTLCFLNPYSHILTTPVCYLQYSSFLSTNNSIYAVWCQFINQPQNRRSRWFLVN